LILLQQELLEIETGSLDVKQLIKEAIYQGNNEGVVVKR
jgi:hypothetical protein